MDLLNTHDIGRLYWHLDKREKSWAPTQISRSQAVDGHLRRGLGVFLSIPRARWGLVIGWWGRRELRPNPDAMNWWANRDLPVGVRVIGDNTEQVRRWGQRAAVEQKVHDGVQD